MDDKAAFAVKERLEEELKKAFRFRVLLFDGGVKDKASTSTI